eukprot:TRINITY_DN10074_c0_g1_i3.p1 TRINITY_DN10074_c0_g1~~TRINITY_DN10074_c0_g1_i3.p1  ORF type:complete len:794 (-),score=128.48 TRINITY_DN10074_c0_g1_i3:128-2509(-)
MKHKKGNLGEKQEISKTKSEKISRGMLSGLFQNVPFRYILGIFIVFLAFFLWRNSVTTDVSTLTNVFDIVPVLERKCSQLPELNLNVFSQQHADSLLWGTYRSHLYFGMRTRTGPDAVLFGLMWYKMTSNPRTIKIRHVTESNVDIRWIHHNGRDYGKQLINDKENGLLLTTTFLKDSSGNWIFRLKGENDPLHAQDNKSSYGIVYYTGIEHQDKGILHLDTTDEMISMNGYTPSTGNFAMFIVRPDEGLKTVSPTTHYSGLKLSQVWKVEDEMKQKSFGIDRRTRRPLFNNNTQPEYNSILFQKYVRAPFELDYVYLNRPTGNKTNWIGEAQLISENFESNVLKASVQFIDRFDRTFPLSHYDQEYKAFAMSAFSNLIGGISFFYGRNRIHQPEWLSEKDSLNEYHHTPGKPVQWKYSENSNELFTACPSRIYFPRGFVWDEGFHQMLISAWDKNLSMDMLGSWFRLMKGDGWFAREQILGSEAESRVPSEFIIQYPNHGNPPTLHMAVHNIMYRGNLSTHDITFLRQAYKALLLNFIWFLKTQQGERPNSWRWRGAKGIHTFTCGLDDYPRFSNRTIYEEHVDLLSWIVLASKTLEDLATKLQIQETVEFNRIQLLLLQHLDDKHWSRDKKIYADYESEKKMYSLHVGYVSLFPFLFGFVPADSPKLQAILDLLEDKKILSSPFGLRSLSARDKLFGKDENYWRGPIWVNINYLVLRSLHHHYMDVEGPYRERARSLYNQLRSNLVNNLFRVFRDQGDYFEHYSAYDGRGQGQHPFAGWTSLVVLIMAEMY